MNLAERKEKIKRWATIGLIALAGLIVSPVIFLAIKGLIGLAIAAVVGLAVVTFAPWVGMKFANWRVRAITAEASENPIETMTNLLIAKKEAYATFKTAVEDAVTARKDFAKKCEEFAGKYPHRAAEFNAQLKDMSVLVDRKIQALKEAKHMLEEGDLKLTEMRAYWDMSQAAQAANRAAGMDTGDLYEKLKADTAVDAVFESMNRAFAELEVAAAIDGDRRPALENNASPVLDVQTINVESRVRA